MVVACEECFHRVAFPGAVRVQMDWKNRMYWTGWANLLDIVE